MIVKNKDYKEEEVICSECEEETETKPKTGKTEIEFVELPKKINVGEDVILKIIIKNNDDEEHEFDVLSYIYRGSKCYSESREHNLKTIKIDAFDSEIVELEDNIKEAEDGEYSIKVKVKQDNLKTEKEIKDEIEIINIIEEEKEEKVDILETPKIEINLNELEIEKSVEENIIEIKEFDYESSSEKSKKLIKYLILLSLALIVIIIVFKNGRKANK